MPRPDGAEFDNAAPKSRKVELGKLAALLERSGISTDDVARVNRVNAWQGFYKDKEGEAHHVDMVGITLVPEWADGPQWPVVAPAKPCVVRHSARPKSTENGRVQAGWQTAVTLPDMQLGYFRNGRGTLVATHDEAAIDVALQVLAVARPDVVVLHGDNLDLPEFSRYRITPRFVQTTQATIDRAGLLAAQIRAAAGPDAAIVWLEGNHEARLPNYILDNARAAFGLRRAGDPPSSWPVLSVPSLLRLDDHGVTYVPGYPANEWWINDRLRVIHGHQVTSNGSTAHKYLAHERVSTVFGHIHRREWAERTRRTREGARTILALSPGCLCRTDGAVPSTKGGTDLDGMPVASTEDWQQGLAVFTFEPGDGRFVPEQVPILDGWAIYRGREFVGTDREAA